MSGSEARHPGAFVLVEYMGTSLDNGSPNSTSTEQCVRGFDNLGFVVGTSSTLFNEGFLELNSTSEDGVLITAVKAILADVGSAGNDVATIPNPFIGWKPETNPVRCFPRTLPHNTPLRLFSSDCQLERHHPRRRGRE